MKTLVEYLNLMEKAGRLVNSTTRKASDEQAVVCRNCKTYYFITDENGECPNCGWNYWEHNQRVKKSLAGQPDSSSRGDSVEDMPFDPTMNSRVGAASHMGLPIKSNLKIDRNSLAKRR